MEDNRANEQSIRFITSNYRELFRIPDGGTILVTLPDRIFIEKCGYIDDYHTKIGYCVYHICEYAQLLEQNGGQCTPEPETTLKKVAWKLGNRGYLMIEQSENGFRYQVLTRDFLSKTQGWLDQPSWTMNQAREHILDTLSLSLNSRTVTSYEMLEQCAKEVLKASDVTKIEWKDSRYYPGMRTAEHTLSCVIRGDRYLLTYEVSQHDDGEGFVIHSDGKDIWDTMPEPELRKLEDVLARAVDYGHWKRRIDEAQTSEAVREVRYGLYESECLTMTGDQIRDLHGMIDRKETALVAVKKDLKNKKDDISNPDISQKAAEGELRRAKQAAKR